MSGLHGSSEDDRESALRLQRSAQALGLQRKQRLAALVSMRKENIDYLRRVHQGGTFWLNCTLLTAADIQNYARTTVPRQRSLSFFYLALSLGKLLDASPTGVPLVRALTQLVEEWEYHMAGAAVQGVKYVTAKSSSCVYPQHSRAPHVQAERAEAPPQTGGAAGELLAALSGLPEPPLAASAGARAARADAVPTAPAPTTAGAAAAAAAAAAADPALKMSPCIHRFHNAVVYEFLLTPHMPLASLDYVEVFTALCGELLRAFDALTKHPDCHAQPAAYEAVLRVDGRVKQHVIAVAAKELTEVSQAANAAMLEQLRTDAAPPSWPSR